MEKEGEGKEGGRNKGASEVFLIQIPGYGTPVPNDRPTDKT